MNWTKRRIAGNTLALASGEVIQRMLSLTLLTIVARKLGPEQMGIYAFCASLTGSYAVVLNFGFDTFIAREAVRNTKTTADLFDRVLNAKSALFLLTAPIVAGTAMCIFPPEKWRIILIMSITTLLGISQTTVCTMFKAELNGHIHGIIGILNRLLAATGGIVCILSGYGIISKAFAELGATAIMTAASLYYLRKRNGIHPTGFFRFSELGFYLKTWKLGIYQLLIYLSASTGMLLLPFLADDAAAGYFSAVEKIGILVAFIPNVISGTMLPVFSKLSTGDRGRYFVWLQKYFAVQTIAGSLVTALFAGFSSTLPTLLYGNEFSSACPVMLLMSPVSLCLFVNPVLTILLITKDKEGRMLIVFSVAMAVNVLICILLVPQLHERGAAIAAAFANILMLFLQLAQIPADVRQRLLLPTTTVFPIVSALACFIIWKLLEYNHVPVLLCAGIGTITYIGLLFLSGSVTANDGMAFFTLFKRKRHEQPVSS